MARLHLIHGFIGAGKTTYARKLAEETGAWRLTHDEWMIAFYGTNPPAVHFRDYVDRVRRMIWHMAEGLLRRDIDVILDDGFWNRADRDDYRARAKAAGAETVVHALQCPVGTMKSRCLRRTAAMPEGALYIDENAFDALLARYEAAQPGEEGCLFVDSGDKQLY